MESSCDFYFNEKMAVIVSNEKVKQFGFIPVEPISVVKPKLDNIVNEVFERLKQQTNLIKEYNRDAHAFNKIFYEKAGVKSWNDLIKKYKSINFLCIDTKVFIYPAVKQGSSLVGTDEIICSLDYEELKNALEKIIDDTRILKDRPLLAGSKPKVKKVRREKYTEDGVTSDQPIPFGSKNCWYAVKSDNSEAVITELGLKIEKKANWQKGWEAAYGDAGDIFVSPPIEDWVFVVGISLVKGKDTKEQKNNLKKLSTKFGDACYFATHRVSEYHCCIKSKDGKIQREFEITDGIEILANKGRKTKEEKENDIEFNEEFSEDELLEIAGLWSYSTEFDDEDEYDEGIGYICKLK